MVARSGISGSAGRTGVAVSSTELCAADARLRSSPTRTWRAPLDPPPVDGSSWPSLVAALNDLARAVGGSGGELSISLMPPLTEVRRLELPPLGAVELQRVLSRDAARYFVNGRTSQVVGASIPRMPRGRRGAAPVVVAAASARLVTSIRTAAAHAGWTLSVIGPAETAWVAAAIALWPAFGRQSAHVLIAHDDRTDLLQIDGGRLAGVRRFRAGAADAPMIGDVLGPDARVGIAGSLAPRRELLTALTSLRPPVQVPSGQWSDAADHADVLAAHFSGRDAGPLLRSDAAVELDHARSRRATMIFGSAAAALLIASAGIELLGAKHQLATVQAQRATLRPQLSATLVGRNTVTATYAQLAALDSIERASPQWSAVIATLTESVPPDAHLTTIRAHEDSLVIDGFADRAKPVFDALEATDGLLDVRAASPVRRELQDNGAALEHFTIAARIASPSKPVAAARTAAALTATSPVNP